MQFFVSSVPTVCEIYFVAWSNTSNFLFNGCFIGEDRDGSIEAFKKLGSKKTVFLLSTRAGGLGINLATTADVIVQDSEWLFCAYGIQILMDLGLY